ncbi:MAG: hypothetical protein RQ750_12250 [Roseovarius sp.]|nr:hypothetical protein [Roseovarius sp.]
MTKQTFSELVRDHGATAAIGTIASGVVVAAWLTLKRSMVNEAAVKAITEAFQREMQLRDRQRNEDRQEMAKQISDIHADLRELRNTDLRELRNHIMGLRK